MFALKEGHVTAFLVEQHRVVVTPYFPPGTLLEEIEPDRHWLRFLVVTGDYAGGKFSADPRTFRDGLREVSPLEALAGQAE